MAAELDQKTVELLNKPNFATVSTLRKDGTVSGVVVWLGVGDAGTIELNTADGRAWLKNLRRDPRVTITVPNAENPYEFVTISGHVTGEDLESADAHIDALAKKYLGVDSYPFRTPDETRVKLTIEPDRVAYFSAG